jgi:hypothetical protein
MIRQKAVYLVSVMMCVLPIGCVLVSGCGPQKPDIETGIVQTFQATNLSILSQVDWKQVMTQLRGKIGPNLRIEAEGYTKTAAGVDIRVAGGEMEVNTQASGTGGKDNLAYWPEIVQVQQRWERASDEARKDKQKWVDEVTAAVIDHFKATATRPASP